MDVDDAVDVDDADDADDVDDGPIAHAERRILALVNEMRTAGGACPSGSFGPPGPLTMNPALRRAARLHSEDMAINDYFSHQGLDGSSPWDRIVAAGYDGMAIGENIAAGNAAAEATFEQWVESDGHCRNMMARNTTQIGVGAAMGGSFGAYWTQTFGAGGSDDDGEL